ncbi:hypothetical protein HMI56_007106 [Coelomomyces lativittatus]|nr:hypothetical protein HMI56_007106 [Coelomomyces lativittatus]
MYNIYNLSVLFFVAISSVACYLKACKSTSDCLPKSQCIHNRCISNAKSCLNNSRCDEGYVCTHGHCLLELDSSILPNGSYFNPTQFLEEHKHMNELAPTLKQCQILKHLFFSTQGKFWTFRGNATSYLTLLDFEDCCSLIKYGVYCDAAKYKNITYLDWSNRNLSHHWPTWWTALTSLEYLNVAENPNLKFLPPTSNELLGLSEFKYFYPSAFIDSKFPSWIFNLPKLNLVSLHLKNLNLSGYLPCPFPRIYLLDIFNNPNLKGVIDAKYLFLDSNHTNTCISPFSLVRPLSDNFRTPHRLLDFTSVGQPRLSTYTGRKCSFAELFWYHLMYSIGLLVFLIISIVLIALHKDFWILLPLLVWNFWSFLIEVSFSIYLVNHFLWPLIETICLFVLALLSVFMSRMFVFGIFWNMSYTQRIFCTLDSTFGFWFYFHPLVTSTSTPIQKPHLNRGLYVQIGIKNALQLFLSLYCFFTEEFWNLVALLLWMVNSINIIKDFSVLFWWHFIFKSAKKKESINA